jgi:hypothetical protein
MGPSKAFFPSLQGMCGFGCSFGTTLLQSAKRCGEFFQQAKGRSSRSGLGFFAREIFA